MAGSTSAICSPLEIRLRHSEKPRMHNAARRIAGLVVALVGLGQVIGLTIVAWFTLLGDRVAVLHFYNSRADITAWSAPFPGPVGAAIVAAQAAIILIALVLAFRACGAWRHIGHTILLGWLLFWLVRIGHMAIVFGGWFHWALLAVCLCAFAQFIHWRATLTPRGSTLARP
jgi:hypothetical protein